MPTLTIKNLPPRLHKRLTTRAARHHRSLNSEVIACLEAAVAPHVIDPAALIAEANRLRDLVGDVNHDIMNDFKGDGRA